MDSGQTVDTTAAPKQHATARETSDHVGTARALFLIAALLSFGLSVALFFSGSEDEGIFVGLWVPSILALGAFLAPRRGAEGAGRRGGGR